MLILCLPRKNVGIKASVIHAYWSTSKKLSVCAGSAQKKWLPVFHCATARQLLMFSRIFFVVPAWAALGFERSVEISETLKATKSSRWPRIAFSAISCELGSNMAHLQLNWKLKEDQKSTKSEQKMKDKYKFREASIKKRIEVEHERFSYLLSCGDGRRKTSFVSWLYSINFWRWKKTIKSEREVAKMWKIPKSSTCYGT